MQDAEDIWEVDLRLKIIDQDRLYHEVPLGTTVQLVRLTKRVRRVADIHRCLPKFTLTKTDNMIQHDGTVVDDVYDILGRASGYPPKMM